MPSLHREWRARHRTRIISASGGGGKYASLRKRLPGHCIVRQPRQGELARAFRLLGTLGDGARPAPDQVLGLLERLARIVASEFTTLSVCDLAAGRRFLSACPPDPPGASTLRPSIGFLPDIRWCGTTCGIRTREPSGSRIA